jgi:hypothetical protein
MNETERGSPDDGKIFHFDGSTRHKIPPKISALPSIPQKNIRFEAELCFSHHSLGCI